MDGSETIFINIWNPSIHGHQFKVIYQLHEEQNQLVPIFKTRHSYNIKQIPWFRDPVLEDEAIWSIYEQRDIFSL